MSGSWPSKRLLMPNIAMTTASSCQRQTLPRTARSTKDFRNLRRVGFCQSFVWRVAITKIYAKAPSLNVFWRTSCLQGNIDDHKALKDDSICIVYAYCIPQISYGGIVCPSSKTSHHFGGWHQVLNMRHSCSITYSFIWELWPFFIPSYVNTLSNQKAKNGASCPVYIQNTQLVSHPKTNNQMRILVQRISYRETLPCIGVISKPPMLW